MDKTVNFETFWRLMGSEEHFANRKNATREQWNAHPDKQAAIIDWLLAKGAYKKRNPYFFIQDFQLTSTAGKREPTNYKGKPLPMDKRVLSAKYKGEWGMYTQEDVEYFKMEVWKEA